VYNRHMLKFSHANYKIKHLAKHLDLHYNQVASFDLPAGWTCSKAKICKSLASKETGHIKRIGKILCYASKAEAYSPSCRRMRWHNFDSLVTCGRSINKITALIAGSIDNKTEIVRIHSAGDFYSYEYFMAWNKIAILFPNITFYGYTKHLDYATWSLPDNMFLQYSYGSRDDNRRDVMGDSVPTCYIGEYDNQYQDIKVVCGSDDTSHEDYFAILNRESFVIKAH
jgi:hypothetical protein